MSNANYGYDYTEPNYAGTLEGLMSILGAFDPQGLTRPAYTEEGKYQDPFPPYYHVMRQVENQLGPDWMEILGLSMEPTPAPPSDEIINDLYTVYSGDPILQAAMTDVREGKSPNQVLSEIRATYSSNETPEELKQQIETSIGAGDAEGLLNWGGAQSLLTDFAVQDAELRRKQFQAQQEYASQPRYGFEEVGGYDPDEFLINSMMETLPALAQSQETDRQMAYEDYLRRFGDLPEAGLIENLQRTGRGARETVEDVVGTVAPTVRSAARSAVEIGANAIGRRFGLNLGIDLGGEDDGSERNGDTRRSARRQRTRRERQLREREAGPLSYEQFVEQGAGTNWRTQGVTTAPSDVARAIRQEQRRRDVDQPIAGRVQPTADTSQALMNAQLINRLLSGVASQSGAYGQ